MTDHPAISAKIHTIHKKAIAAQHFVAKGAISLIAALISSYGLAADYGAVLNFTTGDTPRDIALADFNNDGHIDVVVANSGTNTISVLLNDTRGGFTSKTDYTVGTTPYAVAVANLNTGTYPDIAVANYGSNNVSILLNNNDGTFAAATNYSVGNPATDIAIAALDGAFNVDLAVTTYDSADTNISILLSDNATAGTFGAATAYSVGSYATAVVADDFNNDTNIDLAVTLDAQGSVAVLDGAGDGTFATPPTTYSVGAAPWSVISADLDNTTGTFPDLAVGNYGTNTITVLINNAGGGFIGATDYEVGYKPRSLATATINSGSYQDLVSANQGGESFSVLLSDEGTTPGTFSAATHTDAGSTPNAIGSADLNSDTYPDLVVANGGDDTLSVYLNTALLTPTAFNFINQSNVSLNSVVTSNSVTISGLTAAYAPIQVSNGEYSINNGTFTSASGFVSNGDTVRVRVTSSSSRGAIVDATVVIGGQGDTFSVVTGTSSVTSVNPDDVVGGAIHPGLLFALALLVGLRRKLF